MTFSRCISIPRFSREFLFFLVCSFLMGGLTLYFFFQNVSLNNELKDIKNNSFSKDQNFTELQLQLTGMQQELWYCLEDIAKIGESYQKPYSPEDFGLYSSMFEGKEINFTSYLYKGHTILQRSLYSEEDQWAVSVWELTEFSNDWPTLELADYPGTHQDFPVFDGYENMGSPIWISQRMEAWKKSESFQSKHNIPMRVRYGYAPKMISSVHLEFYLPYTPATRQAFVVLSKSIENYDGGNIALSEREILNLPGVLQAKEKVKEIANTISLEVQ